MARCWASSANPARGKSVTMLAVMGLLPPRRRASRDRSAFAAWSSSGRPQRELAKLRGARIAMIFQDPLTALNPVMTIGAQIAEAIRLHDPAVSLEAGDEARRRAAGARRHPIAERARLQYPARILRWHAAARDDRHGGGQRARTADRRRADDGAGCDGAGADHRAVCGDLQRELKLGLVLITHDLGVRRRLRRQGRRRVCRAQVVEHGAVDDIFDRPRHPYTRGLHRLAAATCDGEGPAVRDRGIAAVAWAARPGGCAFHPRCPQAAGHLPDRRRRVPPGLRPTIAPPATCAAAPAAERQHERSCADASRSCRSGIWSSGSRSRGGMLISTHGRGM